MCLSTGSSYVVSKIPIPDLSSLSLQNDSDDDNCASNNGHGGNFVTPQKQAQHGDKDVDLETAIEGSDFAALEGLGLKLALMARMGDIAGIRRMTGQSDLSRNSSGSSKSPFASFQGSSTSSSVFSTPDTVVAIPTSPISPRMGILNYSSRGMYCDRVTYSPYITSVKTSGQGISADRVRSMPCFLLSTVQSEVQNFYFVIQNARRFCLAFRRSRDSLPWTVRCAIEALELSFLHRLSSLKNLFRVSVSLI